jgi:hypothetical protein
LVRHFAELLKFSLRDTEETRKAKCRV